MSDFWVFGYGSLIWRPGFEFVEEQQAVLHGRHRALCIHSWVHRGTKENPGLVFGLDLGGCCNGLARLVEGKNRQAVIAYLRERELVTHVYKESWVKLTLQDGRKVDALTYVVDRTHDQYAKDLGLDEVVKRVRAGQGKSGHNVDYVKSTLQSLTNLGIRDKALEAICKRL